jgi:hypothetical protein
MKVYVCQGHEYDGGHVYGVFDSLDEVKKRIKNKEIFPQYVMELEINTVYGALDDQQYLRKKDYEK